MDSLYRSLKPNDVDSVRKRLLPAPNPKSKKDRDVALRTVSKFCRMFIREERGGTDELRPRIWSNRDLEHLADRVERNALSLIRESEKDTNQQFEAFFGLKHDDNPHHVAYQLSPTPRQLVEATETVFGTEGELLSSIRVKLWMLTVLLR